MAMIFAETKQSLNNRTFMGTERDEEDNVLAITGTFLEIVKKLRKQHFEKYARLFAHNADKKLLHRMYIECSSQRLVFETTVENGLFNTFD